MTRSQPSRPLGGGLSSVIRSQLPPGVEALANARAIDVARLSPNPFQPRRTFDQQALAELAASIRADGVLQPLLVRVDPAREGYYQIGAGERRWQAAQRAELAAGKRQDSERKRAVARFSLRWPRPAIAYAACNTAHTSPQRSWNRRR